MSNTCLISAALQKELTDELRQRGIVVWLDKNGDYSDFVDDLARRKMTGEYPFPVVGFRGSFLSMMLALEPHSSGLNNAPLLIHMPGYNEDSIRQTPILEYYKPGYRFRKALDTLIREVAAGRVEPAELEDYLRKPNLTLQDADAWLSHQLSSDREGFAGLLEKFSLAVVVNEMLGENTFLADRVASTTELDVLRAYLHRQTGMTDAWIAFFSGNGGAPNYEGMKTVFAGWLLSMEYVHDLTRTPYLADLKPLRETSKPLIKVCCELVKSFRQKYPERYMAVADEVESRLHDELPQIRPEDLGKIDTFRVEEMRILQAAIDALKARNWEKANAWAEDRYSKESIWLERDQTRKWAWALVKEAANFGMHLQKNPSPLDGADSLEGVVETYRQSAFEVDRAHRQFEQKRVTLLDPRIPHFGDLREVVASLRRAYRTWTDKLNMVFSNLCRTRGFLPDSDFQQRTIYEQVVHPLTLGGEKVAVFHIDGFRFEMATELVDEFSGKGTVVDLKARLAELPSITSVGMNVLAPLASGGRLIPVVKDASIKGFRSGEFTVSGPQDRARAMGTRSVGRSALVIPLSELCEMERTTLQSKVSQTKLLLVHSREIDDAGEANLGPETFEQALRQIRTAFNQLKSVGIKTFVFTADHGFLLQDETTISVPYGKKTDPSRRYILAAEQRGEAGMVNVSLSELGYDGAEGYLLFREDTAEFETRARVSSFVHGGNSLQERVIPVLTVKQEQEVAADRTKYLLEAIPAADVLGLRCLKLKVRFDSQIAMGFLADRNIELALRVPHRPEIRVLVRDVRGAGRLDNGRLVAIVGEDWTEVFFSLHGPLDEKTRVEVFHPTSTDRVAPCLVESWFAVEGSSIQSEAKLGTETGEATWKDGFPDEGVLRIFEHLDLHGSITEEEAGQLLGSPRKFRRFSVDFESYASMVPFRVRIEGTPSGKRYVKER